MTDIIELKNVSFTAQEGEIIHDISVEFESKKTTAIVGPSGCGKSTILKLAAGLLLPSNGKVLYKGKNIVNMNRSENLEFRRDGAFVFQDSALWANQNLYQILELPLRLHYPEMSRSQRADKIDSVTKMVGYRKKLNIRPARLSIGEQKLIAFARAMLCDPALLFLDECTDSLDETAAEKLIDIIRRKQREGTSIIFVSHDLRLIMELADYVVVVVDGRITTKAPMDHILSDLLLNDFFKVGIAS
ncbi:MAG: ATP-binding cassette domain-containing protein [Treponema sp.]|nr:ATP-binding cassette domain-containing protein [Treponema sp.]